MPTIEEFGQSIKQKYPQYQNIDDRELGMKMMEKYPEYKDRVFDTNPDEQAGIWGNIKSDISERWGEAKQNAHKLKSGEINAGEYVVRNAGQGAGAVMDTIGNIAKPIVKPVAKITFEASPIGRVFNSMPDEAKHAVMQTVSTGIKEGSDIYNKIPERYRKDIEGVGNIAALVPAGKVTEGGVKVAGGLAKEGMAVAGDTAQIGKRVATDLAENIGSKNTAKEAMGQILQGETSDISKGFDALRSFSLKGMKTYENVFNRISDKISTVAKEVDGLLSQDNGIYKLGELGTELKTKAGNVLNENFVEKALNHLSELYTKTEDITKKADIEALINKVKNEGLTYKEVNDIARQYGSEFKSFNKVGQQLTSVSSEAYENVRRGLKEVARRGLSGAEAKAKDSLLNSLYNTQRLIERNVESVNKLKQKAEKMGLGRKALRSLMSGVDKVTLGGFRALRETLIQSNVGRKTMNWIDIEKALEKNLNIIEKANKKIEKFEPKSILFKSTKGIRPGLTIQDVSGSKIEKVAKLIDGEDVKNITKFVDQVLPQEGSLRASMVELPDGIKGILSDLGLKKDATNEQVASFLSKVLEHRDYLVRQPLK